MKWSSISDQNIEANIISALLTGSLEPEEVTLDCFVCEETKPIAQAVLELYTKGIRPDMTTIRNHNPNVNRITVADIVANTLPVNIQGNLKVLKQMRHKRQLAKTFKEAYDKLFEESDPEDVSAEVESTLSKLVNEKSIDDALPSIMDKLYFDLKNAPEHTDDRFYGIKPLDKLTFGLHKEEVTTVAAKSGVGKTAFALQVATRWMVKHKKVLIFSREMSDVQVMKRIMASTLKIDANKFRSRSFTLTEWQTIEEAVELFKKYNLHINTTASNLTEIKRRIREVKPELAIIDYLQLLTPTVNEKNREREVATMSRDIKNLSSLFQIPIIQLSQLNDENKDQRPRGERVLRESKAIHQNSNNVIFLHEPTETEIINLIKSGRLTKSFVDSVYAKDNKIIEIILDKQRDGMTGMFLQEYVSNQLKFKDLPDFMEVD